MEEYIVRTAVQLPGILRAYRKASGMTQTALARRLGITQQTLSALERNAAKVTAERLLEFLNILSVEVVLRKSSRQTDTASASTSPQW